MTRIKIHIILIVFFILGCIPDGNATAYTKYFQIQPNQADTTQQDTTKVEKYEPSFRPTYKQQDRFGDPFSNTQSPSPLLLQDPSNLTLDVEIDTGMNYTIYEKVGGLNYRPRTSMSFDQFIEFQEQQTKKEYWKNRSAGLDGESAVSGRRLIPKLYISPIFDRIFGGNFVDIQPNGMVNMDFGGRWQKVANPAVPVNQQRNGGFNYNQQISLNVVGKIGEKLAITANFDNNNTFDYQNNLKIEYTGYEEDIIKKIEIGNVSMPVANSLMTGGQSLFGIKTQLQFGKLYVTGLASRQQGSVKSQSFNQNSDDINDITGIKVTEYDEYKHFFLGHFFRDNYEKWLERLPNVTSSLMIQNIQVYVVKNSSNNQVSSRRSIVALTDLGESKRRNIGGSNAEPNSVSVENTQNDANALFSAVISANIRGSSEAASSALTGMGLVDGVDFITRDNVRKLDPTEYEVRQNLGYISLRSPLNEGEAIAVSYEYTHNGNPAPYQVGELSTANQDAPSDEPLVLKLLKSTRQNLDKPIWDLAMKNIYTLSGARGLQQADFKMQIVYEDNEINYRAPNLNEGTNTNNIPLLQVLKLDQLNRNQDSSPDANFDFIEDITFDSDYGALIFPVLEPFGSTLEAAFTDQESGLKEKYVFNELYELPKKGARLVSLKNKFELLPEFQGRAQSEYLLEGFSILEGSVVVNSGSQVLIEGQHYQVTYLGGAKVIITDQGILNSGNPITISYEEADVFNFSSKWLTGARLDYQLNDNINFGATVLHLSERTGGVSRYSIGNEPVKNTKYGFDVNFQEDSRILTKIIDALPLLSTKEKSTVTFNGEFAQLIPGTSNKVEGESTSYLEDFESAATLYQLGGGHLGWKLGSTPLGSGKLSYNFDKRNTATANPADSTEVLGLGYKRAKLAWYTIDRSLYSSGGNRPGNIEEEDLANAYIKRLIPQDIFNIDRDNFNTNIPIFDLAYFPHERGPYNYNNKPEDYDRDGLFVNPEESFGSISRLLPTNTDFASSNIEYMEFWLMDPFISEEEGGRVFAGEYSDEANRTGGDLIFNLGLVSEDLLMDNIPSYENGLPPDGSDDGTKTNAWGRFTEQEYLTQFFDASPDARANQDIGLDGLDSDRERGFYGEHMRQLFESGKIDQSSIDEAFLNDLSGDDFKFYLDPEYESDDKQILERYKNFNGTENNSPVESGTNSFSSAATVLPDKEDLDQSDSPYASQVEEYFEYKIDLEPGQLGISHPFIVDQVEDNNQHDWFLFRIPLQEPTAATDGANFGSVKDMRLFLTGWRQPVVLRMVNFQMVASQWRKYTGDLSTEGFGVVPAPAEADFEVSVVSIEQNGEPKDGKITYVVPPGIERDLDNTTAVTRRVNEQSLKLCVEDLKDGDARGAFKTPVNVDLVNYKRLRMFFHAEAVDNKMLLDDEVKGFLRLARDESENYYEVELNLKVTNLGESSAEAIWPELNEINLALNELYDLKSARNRGQHPVTQAFSQPSQDGRYRLSIVGNPKLSNIQYMMIGVRNPKDEGGMGLEKSVCIWANELRVTGFDNQNGWAANARMNVQLADFATVNGSTRYTSSGFGGLQDKIGERTREDNTQYDVSANINVDKLIPWKTGVKIPMFLGHSKSKQTPRYDPLDNDTPLESTLRDFNTDEERDDYTQKVVSQRTSKSINFIDVHKEKVKEDAKQHIYDIENFSFSYSYSEEKSSNQNTAERLTKKYFGSIAYVYSPQAPVVEPFKNVEAFSSPYLQLIKDINFSPLPNNISARASIDRSFMRTQLRNANLSTDGITPNYEKLFYFDRTYSVRWNLFKNLSINYNAVTNAIIDEAEGDIDTQAERDAIWSNIKSMGRTKRFTQSIGANYRLPLDKIPLTDWISADYRYDVNYNWNGASRDQVETFGNQVDNTRSQDINGKFDLVRLYNKSAYLKSINTPPKRSRSGKPDTTQQASPIFKGLWRLIMSVRSVNVTLSRREGTGLAGLLPNPYMFGLDSDFSSPGLGFVLGDQNPLVRKTAARNDWLVQSESLTTPFMQNLTEEINIKTTIEPFRDFRIQVDMRRSNTSQYQEFFRFDPTADASVDNGFRSLTPTRSGSYSITFMPIATSFIKDDELNSEIFNQFVANREIIQARLSQLNNGETYGSNSQDVVVPAFIAAYTGASPSGVKLSPFPTFPMPNWRLDYAGLSKIPSLQSLFASVNITHAYTSTFSISNYVNSFFYTDESALNLTNNILDYPLAYQRGTDNILVPLYTINQITVAERFSPLVGINLRTKSMISIKVEYSRERNVLMDLSNTQISELKSNDVTFDLGIAKDEWKIPFKVQGRTVVVRNAIQFRMAFTIRDTRTIQRRIEELGVITDGNLNYQIRPTISYVANQKLNLTMYYEKSINEPKISSSYPRTGTSFGVQLQFNLAQ